MFIIVTGASQGIGFEVVKHLSADDENVILAIARNKKQLSLLNKTGTKNIITISGDITRQSTHSKIISIIKKHKLHVDVLINNAATLINKPFNKINKKELTHLYDVNVFSPFVLSQQLLPFMGKKNKSHIVNIGSKGGFQGSAKFPGLSAYSSSKSAIAGLTECLAEELKPLNIYCNCLALGGVQTEMLAKAFPGYKAPLNATQMAQFIAMFALTGQNYFNGKILPVSTGTP